MEKDDLALSNEVNFIPPMTLRDWFAGQALSAMLVNGYHAASNMMLTPGQHPAELWANTCYHMADAMLEARK